MHPATSMRSYMKRRNMFDKLKIDLGLQSLSMPELDAETKWFSTIILRKQSYEARRNFQHCATEWNKYGICIFRSTSGRWQRHF